MRRSVTEKKKFFFQGVGQGWEGFLKKFFIFVQKFSKSEKVYVTVT